MTKPSSKSSPKPSSNPGSNPSSNPGPGPSERNPGPQPGSAASDPDRDEGRGPGGSPAGGSAGAVYTQLAPGVRVPAAALSLTFSRAGGPGGQNVNKASTRAQLSVDLAGLGLAREVLDRLVQLAGSRATTDGRIVIASGVHRSQRLNADECQRRLAQLIQKARTRPKTRRPTKPSAGSKRRRLEGKKRRGDLKRLRRRPSDD